MARSRLDKKTAILLSGGIDSAALAYWYKPAHAIHINYGQKCAEAELTASKEVSKAIGMNFITIYCDLSALGSGDMSSTKALTVAPVSEWWPYRNQMLATIGAMRAISLDVKTLLIGAVRTDGKHIDGTKAFFKKLNNLVSIQEGSLAVEVPAIELDTEKLIRNSKIPLSILGWTHSCHTGNLPCGTCNGCRKHILVKQRIGILK